MSGGRAQAMHALTIEDGAGRIHHLVLRRWARPGWAEDDPDFTPAHEAAVLAALAASDIEARAGVAIPRVVAADLDGAIDGIPALLLTMLPGRARARNAALPRASVRRLAETLVAINELDAGLRGIVRDYRPFSEVSEIRPPAASTRPLLWQRAIEAAETLPPGGTVGFMHRDFHPGNALWEGNRLTAIVDWTQASWGPSAADLGHLRVNLAADQSVELADAATDAYIAAGGRLEDAAYWDLRSLLDWLPDLDDEYASGPGLARLERYLERLLDAADAPVA